MSSLFVYRTLVMYTISKEKIREFENIVHKFLWKGKRACISMKLLCRKKDQGGLRLVNMTAKQNALKITWISKLKNDTLLATCAYHNLDPHLADLIWKCNISPKDVKTHFSKSLWKEVLKAWSVINFWDPQNKSQVQDQVLWLNSNIKVRGKLISWYKWIGAGILLISDIFCENGERKTINDISELGVEEWLNLSCLQDAIPSVWVSMLKDADLGERKEYLYDHFDQFEKTSKIAYDMQIENHRALLKYRNRWASQGYDIDYVEYQESFARIYKCCKTTKFRDFQYRLLLGKLVTNRDLYDWGVVLSDRCTFCKTSPETLEHILIGCEKVQSMTELIHTIYAMINGSEMPWQNYLLNKIDPEDKSVINFICIVTKQFLYRCRCKGKTPHKVSFQNECQLLYNIELFEAKANNKMSKHNRRWIPIKQYVDFVDD